MLAIVGATSTLADSGPLQSRIDKKLRRALDERSQVSATLSEGVVTLTGTARTLWDQRRAVEVVGEIAGVREVVDQVELRPMPVSTRALRESLYRAMDGYREYTVFDYVYAREYLGEVTLLGEVTADHKRAGLERAVARLDGVVAIDNQIEVLSGGASNDTLRSSVYLAIYRHPAFQRYAAGRQPSLRIIVADGEVTLKGRVGTPLERQIAEAQVRELGIVNAFRNELEVDRPSRQER